LALDVSAYFSTIAEGVVLILAVLASSIGPKSAAVLSLRRAGLWMRARSAGVLASQVASGISNNDKRLSDRRECKRRTGRDKRRYVVVAQSLRRDRRNKSEQRQKDNGGGYLSAMAH
jgi:hypothetical protein